MKKEKNESGGDGQRGRVSASFVTGAIALVFLVLGYQTAVFVHRAAVAKIIADRDCPDTVYVIDRSLAESIMSSAGAVVCPAGEPDAGNPESNAGIVRQGPAIVRQGPVVVRKDAVHHPVVQHVRDIHRPAAETFRFNPNTVSVDDLVRLGFSRRQAVAIDNYRKKGGRFRRRSDFAKSYVVADSVFRRLEPYIDIPRVDLNLADSAAFDGLPGIGGYFAAKMTEYRKSLGGSYSYKEQLMDIRNFDREKYDGLSDLITIDSSFVRPYPLWTLPEDSLRLHPYIRYGSAAHGIVLFRENNPQSSWTVEELEKAGVLSPEMAAKLSRCSIARPR